MSDDRSERLRRRRKQSTAAPPAGATDDTPAPEGRGTDDGSERSGGTGRSGADQSGTGGDGHRNGDGDGDGDGDGYGSVSIKEEQVGTYMYLPESQRKEMRRLYNLLKAEYEFEYGDEFEKNRHFYPLVVQFGLESLDGLEASEIRARLDEIA